METSSFSREVAPSCGPARDSIDRRAMNFMKTSKRKYAHQEPVKNIWAPDGVADYTFAVQLDFHLRQPVGLNGIVVRKVGGPHNTAHHDDLRFRIDLDTLGAFQYQIPIGQ